MSLRLEPQRLLLGQHRFEIVEAENTVLAWPVKFAGVLVEQFVVDTAILIITPGGTTRGVLLDVNTL